MNRFAPALRRTARELDLPRRRRAAILLEMAGDLEAVYEYHRERGLDEEEAVRRAEETVLASSEVLRRLGRLHSRSWREWSEGTGDRLTGGTDLLVLVFAVAPMVVLAGAVAVPLLLGEPRSLLAWAVLGTGIGILALTAVKAADLLRGTAGPALRRGLPTLLLLSVVAPVFGLLAVAMGLHGMALALSAGALLETAQLALAERLARDGGVLVVGLLVGIAGALAWFILMNRAFLLDIRELNTLLEDLPPPDLTARRRTIIPLVRRRR